jgi:hypothetical protein
VEAECLGKLEVEAVRSLMGMTWMIELLLVDSMFEPYATMGWTHLQSGVDLL